MQYQESIGVKVQERKRKYEEEKKNLARDKAVWNTKWRKWVHPFTQRVYIQLTLREVFKDLTDEPNNSKDFKSATKFVSCCLEKLQKGEFNLKENYCKNKYCVIGATTQKKLLRYDMAYLIILFTLDTVWKGDYHNMFSFLKLNSFMKNIAFWKLKLVKSLRNWKLKWKWLQKWCQDYRISPKYPNKWFSITQKVRKRRIMQFL